jgi:hypothetical protein
MGFRQMGMLNGYFKGLEVREKLEGRPARDGWTPDAFDQHRRIRELQRSEQELRQRGDD